MSSYADQMIEATNSWAAAYLQFVTGRDREGFSAYAFVEDNDDMIFFQHALTCYDNISYLGCGGKAGVTAVYDKLKGDPARGRQMFFVDRDTEQEPFDREDILRTRGYSWESHLCPPHIVNSFLQRRCTPNLSMEQRVISTRKWCDTVHNFRNILEEQLMLLCAANRASTSLGMSSINFLKDCISEDGTLKPSITNEVAFQSAYKIVVKNNIDLRSIDDYKEMCNGEEIFWKARGKTLTNILRRFLPECAQALGRTIVGEYQSARQLCLTIAWNHEDFTYIREYALGRIGHPNAV